MRVVGDVAEQAGEEVHVGDAGKRVLGELRHVEHGHLAILLFHLVALRIGRGGGAALEDLPERPGIGGDAGQLFLLGQAARRRQLRDRRFCGGSDQRGRPQSQPG